MRLTQGRGGAVRVLGPAVGIAGKRLGRACALGIVSSTRASPRGGVPADGVRERRRPRICSGHGPFVTGTPAAPIRPRPSVHGHPSRACDRSSPPATRAPFRWRLAAVAGPQSRAGAHPTTLVPHTVDKRRRARISCTPAGDESPGRMTRHRCRGAGREVGAASGRLGIGLGHPQRSVPSPDGLPGERALRRTGDPANRWR